MSCVICLADLTTLGHTWRPFLKGFPIPKFLGEDGTGEGNGGDERVAGIALGGGAEEGWKGGRAKRKAERRRLERKGVRTGEKKGRSGMRGGELSWRGRSGITPVEEEKAEMVRGEQRCDGGEGWKGTEVKWMGVRR